MNCECVAVFGMVGMAMCVRVLWALFLYCRLLYVCVLSVGCDRMDLPWYSDLLFSSAYISLCRLCICVAMSVCEWLLDTSVN